jgi:hypothetical protein
VGVGRRVAHIQFRGFAAAGGLRAVAQGATTRLRMSAVHRPEGPDSLLSASRLAVGISPPILNTQRSGRHEEGGGAEEAEFE